MQANFLLFSQMVLELLPQLMRSYFKQCWDSKYTEYEWQDGPVSGVLLVDGLLPCGLELPGTVELKHGSGIVQTSEDLRGLLQEGDFVMVERCVFTVLEPIKCDSFSTSTEWKGNDVATVRMFGQSECLAKSVWSKAMAHALPRLKAGDRSKWDLSILSFILLNSSHFLMQGKEEHQLKAVQDLLDICCSEFCRVDEFTLGADNLERVSDQLTHFIASCLPGPLQFVAVSWLERSQQQIAMADSLPTSPETVADSFQKLQQQFKQLELLQTALAAAEQAWYLPKADPEPEPEPAPGPKAEDEES